MNKLRRKILEIKLVEDDIDTIKDNMAIDDVWYLGQLLENGFKGYVNLTDEELKADYENRGLKEREDIELRKALDNKGG